MLVLAFCLRYAKTLRHAQLWISMPASPESEAMPSSFVQMESQGPVLRLHLDGAWRLDQLTGLENMLQGLHPAQDTVQQIEVEGKKLASLDTAGAWVLARLLSRLHRHAPQAPIHFSNMPPHAEEMLRTVAEHSSRASEPKPPRHGVGYKIMARLGKASIEARHEAYELFSFMGQTFVTLARSSTQPKRLRFNSIIRHIDETGIDAIPIVSMMAFMIAIVLAYQGIQQLAKFGAEIFTVNMVGISVLREMGVLLTAIMIAGRSGSAFTAEIGVMKVNEEVDAMRVMGLDPFELLVLPRFLALLISLPILTVLADAMGLLGGAIVFHFTINISLHQYLDQIIHVVKAKDFWVGVVKAPFFALLISVVGCLKGMQVSGSAESVGQKTTSSVVASIFLVLLADAVFAVFFTKMGI